jgi:chromosomal replication initiation ATPase DnaA
VTFRAGPDDPRLTQLPLDLRFHPSFARSDFLSSERNVAALERIDRWPDWPAPALVLHGPRGCGKTHLAHLWCERAAAVLIAGDALTEAELPGLLETGWHGVAVDDAERAWERGLLHLYNACAERRGSLLITTRQPPGLWQIALGDLRSRLRATPAVEIEAPDDALLGAVLVKHFADRRVPVAPGVIVYLLRRIGRTFAAAATIAARLDAAALSSGGPITIPLARQILTAAEDQSLVPRNDSTVT